MSVDNDVVTTTIHQVLVNDLESPVEVVFRHRLPNDAVVTQFGDWRWGEFVAAALKESSSADAEYESASASGRSASLGEVGRGNLFQMKLFGIPALGTRRIKLSYTYTLMVSERKKPGRARGEQGGLTANHDGCVHCVAGQSTDSFGSYIWATEDEN